MQAGRLQTHEVWTCLNTARQGVSGYLLHPVANNWDKAKMELGRLREALDNGRQL
jgi:hypothetical protein